VAAPPMAGFGEDNRLHKINIIIFQALRARTLSHRFQKIYMEMGCLYGIRLCCKRVRSEKGRVNVARIMEMRARKDWSYCTLHHLKNH